jgi:ABC-type lipoprotein release transport system permease subunit
MTEDTKSFDLNSLFIGIIGSIIGGFFVYWILKDINKQSNIITGQQYLNNERWYPIRDISGRIVDLHVSTNAQINDGNRSHTIYRSIGPVLSEYSPETNIVNNQIASKISVDQLTDMVNQRLQKRWIQLNKKENDMARQRRFNMV